jgi:flagellar hook-length control protein FliK
VPSLLSISPDAVSAASLSPPRIPTPPPSQDPPQPFADLLNTGASVSANTLAAPTSAEQHTQAPANNGNPISSGTAGTTTTTSSAKPTPTATPSPSASPTPSSANPTPATSAKAGNSNAAPANQNGAPVAGAANTNDLSQPATAATAVENDGTPTAPGAKKAASDDADTDSGATTAAGAAANPSSPLAAAIVVNSAGDLTPAAPIASGAAAAIGAQSRARPQASMSHLAGTDTETADEPAAAKTGTSAGAAAARPATPDPSASQSATPAGSALTGANSAGFTLPQPGADGPSGDQTNVQATTAIAHADSTESNSTGSSDSAPTTGAAKTAGTDVPNLGIAVANTVAGQTTVATRGASAAGTVSISALPITIAAHAKAGSNQFDIRLDPPELGRIDVRLDVDSNGLVTSHVTADRPETLTLLQNQQPQLERALEQAGLKTADNGLQFSLRDQSFTGQNNNGGAAQPSTPQLVVHDPDLAPIETRQIYARASLGGGIDIRV